MRQSLEEHFSKLLVFFGRRERNDVRSLVVHWVAITGSDLPICTVLRTG